VEPVRDRMMVGVDGISLAVHPGRYFIDHSGRGPHAVGSRDRGQDSTHDWHQSKQERSSGGPVTGAWLWAAEAHSQVVRFVLGSGGSNNNRRGWPLVGRRRSSSAADR
jgi:hypothetical protein